MVNLKKNKINKEYLYYKLIEYNKKEKKIKNSVFLYYKALNIPKDILNFNEKKRYYLFKIRNLYLSLGELGEKKLDKIKLYFKEKEKYANMLKILNNSFSFDKYIFSNPVNYLLFVRIVNALMYDGKKSIVITHLKKTLSLLKIKYGIKDPLNFIMDLLYNNLVPIVKSRKVNNKKIIGVYLNIYQRIGLTVKIFVKGIRTHKIPLYLAILKEILELFKGESFLIKNNNKMLTEIEDLKLYKYLNMGGEISLFPERMENNNDHLDVMKIDWKNFNKIVQDLRYILLLEKIRFEKEILKALKNYVILTYFINKKHKFFNISEGLKIKYNILQKHKSFTYSFFDEDYLEKKKKNKDYIDLTKNKINKNKKKSNLNSKEKLEVLRIKMFYYINIIKENFIKKFRKTSIKSYENIYINENEYLTYQKGKYDFVFWEYLFNPEYLHLKIKTEDIINFMHKNEFNFFYLPCFRYELIMRNDNAKKLSEEDFLLLFMGENPNLIFLNLKAEKFYDINDISEHFEKCKIWDGSIEDNDNEFDY